MKKKINIAIIATKLVISIWALVMVILPIGGEMLLQSILSLVAADFVMKIWSDYYRR